MTVIDAKTNGLIKKKIEVMLKVRKKKSLPLRGFEPQTIGSKDRSFNQLR